MAVTFPGEATPAEDGGVYFKALVDGKVVHCRVALNVLERHFGSEEGLRPIDAYANNKERLHAIAEGKLQRHPDEPVFIQNKDVV